MSFTWSWGDAGAWAKVGETNRAVKSRNTPRLRPMFRLLSKGFMFRLKLFIDSFIVAIERRDPGQQALFKEGGTHLFGYLW